MPHDRITIHIRDEKGTKERLQLLATVNHRSESQEGLIAIEEHLSRNDSKIPRPERKRATK